MTGVATPSLPVQAPVQCNGKADANDWLSEVIAELVLARTGIAPPPPARTADA